MQESRDVLLVGILMCLDVSASNETVLTVILSTILGTLPTSLKRNSHTLSKRIKYSMFNIGKSVFSY
jgi:hypothetical protein